MPHEPRTSRFRGLEALAYNAERGTNRWPDARAKLATLVTLNVICSMPKSASAAGEALDVTVAQKLCDFSGKAKGQPAKLSSQLTAAAAGMSGSSRSQRQLFLAWLALPKLAEATATMTIYAQKLASLHSARHAQLATTGTKLAGAATYAAGRTDETILLLNSLKKDGDDNAKFCIGAASNDNNQGTPANLGICEAADVFSATAVEADLSAEIKTAFTAHSGSGAAIHNTQASKCYLTQNLNTALETFTGTLKLLGGIIEIQAAGSFGNNNKFKTSAAQQPILKALHDHHANHVTVTKATIQKAPTTLDELKQTLSQYEQNSELRQAARQLHGWPSSKTDDDVNSHLKSLFGIDAATGEHKYTKALDGITLKVKDGDSEENKKILEMSDEQLDEATYKQLTELAKAAAKKLAVACDTQTGKIDAAEQTCAEAGTDRDKCKELKAKDCTFNDKAKKV